MNKFIKRIIYAAAIASAVATFLAKKAEEGKEEKLIDLEKTRKPRPEEKPEAIEETPEVQPVEEAPEIIENPLENQPEEYFQQPEEYDEPQEEAPELGNEIEEMEIPDNPEVNLVTEEHTEIEDLLTAIENNNPEEETAEEPVEEPTEEPVEEPVEEPEVNIIENAPVVGQVDVETSDLDTLDELDIEDIINEVMEGAKEEEPVAEEIPDEVLPQEEPEVVENEEEPVEIMEEPVEEPVEEVQEEPAPEEEPAPAEEEEEIVDESFEEPVVEEVKEPVEEPVVEEPEVEVNPFPHLTENKVNSIKNKIQSMINVIGECRELELLHYIVFANRSDFDAYRKVALDLRFEVEEDINDNGEVYLSNTVAADTENLNHSILTLADTVAAYRGSYKGWKVKDVIE